MEIRKWYTWIMFSYDKEEIECRFLIGNMKKIALDNSKKYLISSMPMPLRSLPVPMPLPVTMSMPMHACVQPMDFSKKDLRKIPKRGKEKGNFNPLDPKKKGESKWQLQQYFRLKEKVAGFKTRKQALLDKNLEAIRGDKYYEQFE